MSAAKKHTLLVVDDEIDVCDSVHDLLRRDFKVFRARNADEGMKILEAEEVHIIMTDQRMPKSSGVELLKRARQGHPQAVRMLFTGFADVESVIAAINQGHVFRFLKKPWQIDELQDAVKEAAAEYDRLIEQAETMNRLLDDINGLRTRVASLEDEVKSLKGV